MAYFAIAMALVAALLPTSLRPPPEDPTTSAEFSPDAPPDDQQESILSALSRGRSASAGAGPEAAGTAGRELLPPERRLARNCPLGIGDPPRQVESLYSGPCAPAWRGDNGGATSKNVFPGEVHVGFYHSTDGCDGPIPTEPPDNEGSANRTMRVLQAYANQAFETYGRQVRFYCMPGGDAEDSVQADEEWKIFAASSIDFRACRELIRRKMPVFCDPPTREDMLDNSPFLWAQQMDRTRMQELGGEYYCKKLVDKPARFAGEASGYRSVERKLGIITEMSAETGLTEEAMIPAVRRECGVEKEDIEHIVYTARGGAEVFPEEIATAIARLRTEGVTTVVLNVKFFNVLATMEAADAAAYYPEWVMFSPYGLDINIVGNLMPQSQMTQAFGLSGWEWPRSNQETECYRAYRLIDPNNTPNAGTCGTLWFFIVQLMSGIQGAGPHLTPETFRDGLFGMGYRFYEDIPYAIGGGYGPTDYTYVDNVSEIWWDPTAAKPEDGSPGAYRWVRCGRRYRDGELPREDPLVFQDGATGPGRDGCR